jgi:hypothetical protein
MPACLHQIAVLIPRPAAARHQTSELFGRWKSPGPLELSGNIDALGAKRESNTN